MANNVFQKVAGGFKRVLPGLTKGAQIGSAAGMPVLGAAVGAASSLLKPKAKPAGTTGGSAVTPGADAVSDLDNRSTGSARALDFGYSGPAAPTMASESAPSQGAVDQFDGFNLLLTDALRRSQGVNTDELLKRRRALQRASIGRSDEITPEELRTLSPEQQAAIRSGNMKALEPDIDENAYQIQRANTIAANFEKAFTEAKKFGEDFAEKIEAPADVISAYTRLIEADPDNLATILSGVNEKTRMKVISALNPAAFAAAKAKKGSSADDFFTDTQVANGAAAAGMTIAEFKALSVDEQNKYINDNDSKLPLPPDQLAGKIVDKLDTLFRSKAKAKTKAKEIVSSGKITSNGKTYTLTPAHVAAMLAAIEAY